MKTAVVTGASYGIGQSIAEALLREGWRVYGLSRSQPEFKEENFAWLQCDLSQPDQIPAALKAVTESTIDALVSNAGVIEIENATDVSKSSYEKTFSVNVLAPMLVVNALRDKITNATIISVSSVSDRIPEADMALYCSSKAANTLYFDALSDELKDARVLTLLPSYVDTPMLRGTVGDNKGFDWSATIKPDSIAKFSCDLILGTIPVESGANIIIVTEKLKDGLRTVEKLYGLNTDTNELVKL